MNDLILLGIAALFGWLFLLLMELWGKRRRKKIKKETNNKILANKTSTQLRIEKTQEKYASILRTRVVPKKTKKRSKTTFTLSKDIKSIKSEVMKMAQELESFVKSTKKTQELKISKCSNCNWETTEAIKFCENCGEYIDQVIS